MKKVTVAILLAGISLVALPLTCWTTEAEMAKGGGSEIKKGDFVTVCNPGKECGKSPVAVKDPKECRCGAEAEKLSVLKVEGEVAILCQCGGGCACDLSPKNPYLCGCGTPVKVVRIVK